MESQPDSLVREIFSFFQKKDSYHNFLCCLLIGKGKEYLDKSGSLSYDLMEIAIKNKHHQVVNFLQAHKIPFSDRCLELACANNDLKMIKTIHESGVPLTDDLLEMDMIETVADYFRENGLIVDTEDSCCQKKKPVTNFGKRNNRMSRSSSQDKDMATLWVGYHD